MGIKFWEDSRVFKLDTAHTSYLIGIVDEPGYVCQLYYGKKVRNDSAALLFGAKEDGTVPSKKARDKVSFLDAYPFEYPTAGIGDFRETCLQVRTQAGHVASEFFYESYEILPGKPSIPGLPAGFGSEKEVTTLKITCVDLALALRLVLTYSVFETEDVITRSVEIQNGAEHSIYLTKALSACLDVPNEEFELLTMHGSWARERHIQKRVVGHGFTGVASRRGESSHQDHPFVALANKNADDDKGNVYAMHFVYSGNFVAQAEESQFGLVRAVMGIHPENFCWKLEKNESFYTPEVVLTYSASGFGQMTRNLHDFYRQHMIRSPYKDKERPVLINNWEATYFNFDTEKLLGIAKQASELGIEMLVMDDGWFGNRFDDNRALGDWKVNEEKLKGGLTHLVEEVNKLGMKFGIWFEPEMISPDSDLYRAHPDWAIAVPGRTASLCRCQYVLDLSRKEVRDYAYECVADILRSANIEYVKWDMNRQLTDLGSLELPYDRQGELYHRYVLAVYELQERLLQEFPNLLLENCSGGGARFDPGMLYYSPQIWCSDDTDAIERLLIQEGTAMIYPLSTMGAHVSDCPNHTVGRVTPFETRGHVALAGTFGYELDVTKIPPEDRALIPSQIDTYHKYHKMIRNGDYYRVASYGENQWYDCYGIVDKDKKEALFTYVQVLKVPNMPYVTLKLKGLNPEANYKIDGKEGVFAGDALMYVGLRIPCPWGDFKSVLIHLVKC